MEADVAAITANVAQLAANMESVAGQRLYTAFSHFVDMSTPLNVPGAGVADPGNWSIQVAGDYTLQDGGAVDCYGDILELASVPFRDLDVEAIDLTLLIKTEGGNAVNLVAVRYDEVAGEYHNGDPVQPHAVLVGGNANFSVSGYDLADVRVKRNTFRCSAFPGSVEFGKLRLINPSDYAVEIHSIGLVGYQRLLQEG